MGVIMNFVAALFLCVHLVYTATAPDFSSSPKDEELVVYHQGKYINLIYLFLIVFGL